MLDLQVGNLQIVGILFLGLKKSVYSRGSEPHRLCVALSIEIKAKSGPEIQRTPAVPHPDLSLLCSAELSAPELSVGFQPSPKSAPRLGVMPEAPK